MLTTEERLARLSVPEPNTGCVLWLGCCNHHGYAVIGKLEGDNRTRLAHIVAYEAARGAVPSGMVLDHLCRVRSCINPRHLEPVTPRENSLRGDCAASRNAAKTHCPRGHAYSGENLLMRQRASGEFIGRGCKKCIRATAERRRQERSVEAS